MTSEMIVALITGGCSLVGVIVSNIFANKKVQNSIETHQAVTDEQIKALSNRVEKHNSVIDRTYVVEQRIEILIEKQKTANHRIADLEEEIKNIKE